MQGLQGVHIIEGMIQLLADSLEFQLLSVQFICRSKGRVSRTQEVERKKCAGHEGEIGKREKSEQKVKDLLQEGV